MKQTFTKESIVLLDGEIVIKDSIGLVLYTTHPHNRLGKLDRKAFVKPDPDIIFTREDMELSFKAGCLTNSKVGWSGFEEFMNNLRPLSIPASVTIENNQVIEVIW